MWAVNKVKDISAPNVTNFPGLLSCLAYSTAHTEFASLVKKHWSALNRFSGKPLLIVVADEPEMSSPKRTRANFSIPPGAVGFMTSWPGYEAYGTDAANAEIIKHFKIARAKLPCIIFFDQLENPKALTFSFRDDKDLLTRMMEIFDDCESVWTEPSSRDRRDLPDYRRKKMDQLAPLLRRKKFLKFVSGMSNNATFAALIGAIVPFLKPGA